MVVVWSRGFRIGSAWGFSVVGWLLKWLGWMLLVSFSFYSGVKKRLRKMGSARVMGFYDGSLEVFVCGKIRLFRRSIRSCGLHFLLSRNQR